jgi:molecular chaperone HscC
MARAKRLFEERLRETRMLTGKWTTDFSAALESQDPRRITKAREQLTAFLGQIESQAPIIE